MVVIIIPITICSVISERDDWRGHLQDRNSGEILHQPNRLEDDQSRAGYDSLAWFKPIQAASGDCD